MTTLTPDAQLVAGHLAGDPAAPAGTHAAAGATSGGNASAIVPTSSLAPWIGAAMVTEVGEVQLYLVL